MALSLGQLLGGAGRLSRSIREEQEAQRTAQANEMRLQEMRRLEAQRRAQQEIEAAQARMALGLPQGQIQYNPGMLPIAGGTTTPQAQPMPSRTDAAEMVRMQAAQRQAQEQAQAQEVPAQQAGVRQRRVPTDPLQMGAAPFRAYAQRQTERMRDAPQTIPGVIGTQVAGVGDLLGSTALGAGSYLQSLLATEGPVESAVRGQYGRMTEPMVAFGQGLGLDISGNPMLDAYDRFTGRVSDAGQQDAGQAEFIDGDYLDRVNEGRPLPEPQPAAVTEEPEEPTETPEQVAEQRTAMRDAGVSEESQTVLTSGEAYKANPEVIPLQMRQLMAQRENAVRLANMYINAGLTQQGLQAALSVQEIDNNLLYLQGMQAITEARDFNDPRRLSAVMQAVTGDNIQYQLRSDGNYNIVRVNEEGELDVVQSNVPKAQALQQAELRFSPAAREEAARLARLRAEAQVEISVENQKTMNDIAKAFATQDLELAKTFADNAGMTLNTSGEFPVLSGQDRFGNPVAYRYEPGQEEQRGLFGGVKQEGIPEGWVQIDFPNQGGLLNQSYQRSVNPDEILSNWNQ